MHPVIITNNQLKTLVVQDLRQRSREMNLKLKAAISTILQPLEKIGKIKLKKINLYVI